MRSTVLAVFIGIVLLGGLLGGGAVLFWTRSGEEQSFGGWRVAAGEVEERGGELFSVEASKLDRDGSTLTAPAGTRFRVDGQLPTVAEGTVEFHVDAAATVDDYQLASGTTVLIAPGGLTVLAGRLTTAGIDYGPGMLVRPTLPGPVETAPVVSGSTASTGGSTTGRVIDARTGAGVVGLTVRVVYSHSPDGYPASLYPESRQWVETDNDGHFTVAPFHVEDPRLHAHLQIDAPGYHPMVRVLPPQDVHGRWPSATLALRPARTVEFRFLDRQQSPLPGEAVAVDEYDDPYQAVDDLSVEDSQGFRDPRVLRDRTRRLYFYTNDRGVLYLTQEWHRAQLLHPFFTTIDSDEPSPPWLLHVRTALDRLPPHERPRLHVYESTVVHDRYHLTDRNGTALDRVELEVEVPEESRFFRVHTDNDGWLAFGVDERPITLPSVRRVGKSVAVVTRTPRLPSHRFDLAIPSIDEHYAAEAREAALLSFRTLALDRGDVASFVPEQLRAPLNMTQVLRGDDGLVQYRGSLPEHGDPLWFAARGYRPVSVAVALNSRGKSLVDLGGIVFEPGEEVTVTVKGLWPEDYTRAWLNVRSPLEGLKSFAYRLDERGQVRLAGLQDGFRYELSLTGDRIPRVVDELWVRRKEIDEGHVITLQEELTPDRDLVISGRLSTIDFTDSNDYRIVERLYYGNAHDPVIHRSYPVAPDGTFGTWRVVPRPRLIETIVLGRRLGFARVAPRVLSHGAGAFDAGSLTVETTRHGYFTFVASGLGLTMPPRRVWLVAETDRNHEIASWSVPSEDYRLLVKHLLPGRYTLEWEEPDGELGSHSFLVDKSSLGFEEVVERPPSDDERILVTIVGADGTPIVGASVLSRPVASIEDLRGGMAGANEGVAVNPGMYEVILRSGSPNVIRVLTDGGHLPASVFVPRGIAIEDSIRLRVPVGVKARLLDANGQLFAGSIEFTWGDEPLDPTADDLSGCRILHGEPVLTQVRAGQLQASGLPRGRREIELRHVRSDVTAKRAVDLRTGSNDLGLIHLEQRRELVGYVALPNGTPAAGARVSLVAPLKADHYPLRPRDKSHERYHALVDADGEFRIPGLPIDFNEDLALVVHLAGFTDAVEYPIDLEADARSIRLLAGTRLNVAPAYAGEKPEGYRFTLSYLPDDLTMPAITLGRLDGGERIASQDVRPGLYRLEWSHDRPLPGFEPRVSEVYLAPGNVRNLVLEVDVTALRGAVTFNGESLDQGWVIFTDDPSDPSRNTLARVNEGRYAGAIPAGSRQLFATVVPERDPMPAVDLNTGQGVPIELNHRDVARGRVSISYEAYDLTVVVTNSADSELTIEAQSYIWRGTRWDLEDSDPVPFTGSRKVFSLVRPGTFKFKVRSHGVSGWTATRTVAVTEDVEVTIAR